VPVKRKLPTTFAFVDVSGTRRHLRHDGVGGPGFQFNDEFDVDTCDAIRARLAHGDRIPMNVTVLNDITPRTWSVFQRKPAPDLIRGGDRFASGKRVKPIQSPISILSKRKRLRNSCLLWSRSVFRFEDDNHAC
jgi:hypothetical protein